MRVEDDVLIVEKANAVTLLVGAATSFVSYKDVSADAEARVDAVMRQAAAHALRGAARGAHVAEHQRLFRRVSLDLGATADSASADRRAAQMFAGRQRSSAAGAAVPVRPLPAHLLVAAGHAAGQPAGHLERQHEPAVGLEVHDQHQHRDELLARRGRQPLRVRGAAVPDDPRADRRGRDASRASTTARAGGSRTRTRISGASRRRWTARAGARSRPAAPGSPRISGSTTGSRATPAFCASTTR